MKNLKEKIIFLKEKLNIKYSEKEKESFDKWLSKIPESSIEKPIGIENTKEIFGFLPSSANYKGERINLFFTQTREFESNELQTILEDFAKKDSSFEISLVKNRDNLISIGIGNKTGNSSTILEGEYFGHYHPTKIELKNKNILPNCFSNGLMPSAGDIKGFLKHKESVKNGTRIFSKNGYVFIKPIAEIENIDQSLEEFSEKYFDLFLGINKFNFKSDNDAIKYFSEKLGFKMEFHYKKINRDDKEI
jgi:hypothetical protein